MNPEGVDNAIQVVLISKSTSLLHFDVLKGRKTANAFALQVELPTHLLWYSGGSLGPTSPDDSGEGETRLGSCDLNETN